MPLSDQKRVTSAIAFLKELDTISTKWSELLVAKENPTVSQFPPNPKSKATPKKKQKGRGKGQADQGGAEEEEQ